MERKKLVLLHGALGSRRQMDDLATHVEDTFIPVALNLPGHGGRPLPDAYSMDRFVEDVAEKLRENGPHTDIFGFSMGGYVALLLAMKYPELVGRIIILGTKFDWTPETAARECLRLEPDKMIEKVPVFAELLAVRHAPQDWRRVVLATRDFLLHLGNGGALVMSSFRLLHPVLILRGSLDQMVTRQESEFIAANLEKGHYEEIPGFRHPLEQADPGVLSCRIKSFLQA